MHRWTKLNLFHKFHQSTQLVLNHHHQTINMTYLINWSNHLTGRTWLIRMITLITTILISTSIILEIMHKLAKLPQLFCRLIHISQQDLSHHQRTGNMMYHIKCWSQSFKKIEMATMTSLICIRLASISIHWVSMSRSTDKFLLKRDHMKTATQMILTLLLTLTQMMSMIPRITIKNLLRHRWHHRRIILKLSK